MSVQNLRDTAAVSDPQPANWRGPCTQNPAAWDIDLGGLGDWLGALRTCQGCPMLQLCGQVRDELWPMADPRRPAHNPRSVIWAGLAYSETGRVLSPTALRRLAKMRATAARKQADAARLEAVAALTSAG